MVTPGGLASPDRVPRWDRRRRSWPAATRRGPSWPRGRWSPVRRAAGGEHGVQPGRRRRRRGTAARWPRCHSRRCCAATNCRRWRLGAGGAGIDVLGGPVAGVDDIERPCHRRRGLDRPAPARRDRSARLRVRVRVLDGGLPAREVLRPSSSFATRPDRCPDDGGWSAGSRSGRGAAGDRGRGRGERPRWKGRRSRCTTTAAPRRPPDPRAVRATAAMARRSPRTSRGTAAEGRVEQAIERFGAWMASSTTPAVTLVGLFLETEPATWDQEVDRDDLSAPPSRICRWGAALDGRSAATGATVGDRPAVGQMGIAETARTARRRRDDRGRRARSLAKVRPTWHPVQCRARRDGHRDDERPRGQRGRPRAAAGHAASAGPAGRTRRPTRSSSWDASSLFLGD